MSFYRVTPGQSPAMVARALGTSVSALMSANRHKPTMVVAGRRTFQSLRYNELLHKPRAGVGALGEDGTLGAVTPAAPGAPHAMIAAGSSGPDVALWQKIIGVTADGSFGNGTAAATKAWQSAHGLPGDGVVGPNTWAKALGNASSAPVAVTAPAGGPSLAIAAGAAYTALNMDPNYCTSVAKSGTSVNTAVHNFKAAWNAANPGHPVPIGTGKYEPVVAAALSSALAGVTVPAGCGGPAVAPPPIASNIPAPPPIVTPVSPSPASTDLGGYNSTQIATATAMNSALAAHGYKQADQGLYMAFQRAMGLKADGYPGTGTMGQLRSVLAASGIPMAQVPIYPWHAGSWDGKNAPTAASWSGSGGGGGGGAAPAPATAAPAPAPVAAAAAAAADAATTPAQADVAAAAAQAAIDAANKAAATATTQKQADDAAAAAKVAQTALDTAAAKGGSAPGTGIVTKKLSTGAIVAGAVGVAAIIGLAAMALTGKKKTGRRGARGPGGKRGKRGPRKSSKHKRKSKR